MSRKAALTVAVLILAAYILVALLSPLIVPYSPTGLVGRPLDGPGESHLLGTNDLGQDIFSRLICGTRATLIIGLLGAILTVLVGTLVGMISAYYGGKVDEFITRSVDVLMTIPGFPLLLVLVIFFSSNIFVISGLMGLLGGTQGVRIIRSQVLSLTEANFVYGAKAMGASDLYIMTRHILPNVLPLVTVTFVFAAQRYMLMGVGLGFLGLGDPSVIDWGQMINRAYSNGGFALGLWWWLIPPGLAVTLLSLVLALLGYSLEERINPRLQKLVAA
jgi:peptide/nickel transport system permease protein